MNSAVKNQRAVNATINQMAILVGRLASIIHTLMDEEVIPYPFSYEDGQASLDSLSADFYTAFNGDEAKMLAYIDCAILEWQARDDSDDSINPTSLNRLTQELSPQSFLQLASLPFTCTDGRCSIDEICTTPESELPSMLARAKEEDDKDMDARIAAEEAKRQGLPKADVYQINRFRRKPNPSGSNDPDPSAA